MLQSLKNLFGVFACSLVLFGGTVWGEDFFAASHDKGMELPSNLVYPQGRLFPFSGFQPSSVGFYKDHQFTLCGPAYGGNIPRMLKDAKALQVPIIYPIHARVKGKDLTLKDLKDPSFTLDEQAIAADLARQVREASKTYPTIAWWYLQPEELRFWRKKEYRYLQVATAAIRSADAQKRPIWMYNPGHYPAKHLSKYAPYLDVMGKGMYTNYSGFVNSRVWVRYSCESQLEGIRQGGSASLPIAVPEMFQNPPQGGKGSPEVWARHDVYLSLLCGSKGVVVFSLAERPTMRKDVHGSYQKAYLRIAEELNGRSQLGQVFLFGEEKHEIQGQVLSGPQEISLQVKGDVRRYPSIAFGDYRHVSGRYLFAVNSSHESVTYRFSQLPQVRVSVVDAVSGQEVLATDRGQFEVTFQPLEVRLFKLIRK